MGREKKVESEGDVITGEIAEKETFQKPKSLSYSQAKKLVKKEMTPKQQEHIEKLKKMNEERRAKAAQTKEEELKEKIRKELEEERKKIEEGKAIIVEPKRVYKPRQPKKVVVEEEEEEEEEEPKAIMKHVEKIERINKAIESAKPVNRYASLIRW